MTLRVAILCRLEDRQPQSLVGYINFLDWVIWGHALFVSRDGTMRCMASADELIVTRIDPECLS